jgi:hypothetical protein
LGYKSAGTHPLVLGDTLCLWFQGMQIMALARFLIFFFLGAAALAPPLLLFSFAGIMLLLLV